MRHFFLSLCICCTTAAFAQDSIPAAGQRLFTLQQCIDYAKAHNISLMRQQVSVSQSEVDIYAAQGELFPSLSFQTNQNVSWRPWGQRYVNVSNGTMTTSTSEVNYNGSYGLNANWTVWNGGRSYKSLKRARKALEQSRSNAEATELDIEEQIVQAYVQILYQTEAVEVNRQILAATEVQADRAREMVEVGTMSRADLAQMQAQVSQEQYNVANAITQLNTFKLNLKRLLQIVDSQGVEVAVPAEIPESMITGMLPAVGEVYADALARRPEVAAAQTGVALADMDIDIARRQYYPTVGINAGINTSNTSGMETGFFDQLKQNLSNMIGVSLSVPIFDNRSASSAVKRAKLAAMESRLELDDTRTQLYSDIEQIWLNADNAREQYLYARTNTEAMQTSYDLVSEQFNVGLKDIVDLTTGKNNLIQARQQMLQAKYTALLNRSLLRFYQGEPLTL